MSAQEINAALAQIYDEEKLQRDFEEWCAMLEEAYGTMDTPEV